MYKESLYPKTESELTELLCDKFWKISEVEVQEIYYDGKLIPKPTSNVVENLKRSFDSDSKEFVYKTLKEKIEINKNYDSYTSFSKNYNYLCGVNTYWCYNQSYDESLSDYKYSISCYTFDHQNGKYSYKSNNLSDSYYSVRNNEFIETTDIISDQSKVDEISSENLIEISDVTLMVDGVKCRVVCKITYEKCIPNNTLRYDEEKSAQAPEVPVE